MRADAALLSRAQAACDRARVLCDSGLRLVESACRSTRPDPDGFVVSGRLDGRVVQVRCRHGVLVADPDVRARLHLVVSLADREGAPPVPSLTGSRAERLVAVLRALDRVDSVTLAVPGAPAP